MAPSSSLKTISPWSEATMRKSESERGAPKRAKPKKPDGVANKTPRDALKKENEDLKARLNSVLENAAANERIWRHFVDIERILFRTRELDVLVEELLREIKARFQPDDVILFLCHADIVERFFPNFTVESDPISERAWVMPLGSEACVELSRRSCKPFTVAAETLELIEPHLPVDAGPIQSAVMIPLNIHEILYGALFLGSVDADHYRPKDGTDLLEQLAVKIALCMENCLTYERVKDFAIQDQVTGLHNFFQIHTILEREFRKARRTENPLSVLLIDPQFYHQENGDFDIGNRVLRHLAEHLQEILPTGEAFLGRYGIDEFLLVLPDVDENEAREVAPYLAQMIRKTPFKYSNTAVLIQTTMGVGSLKTEMKRAQDLLDLAYGELSRLKATRTEPRAKPNEDIPPRATVQGD
jgi:diguanylate cyclase (GGDEF)-like protein